MAERSVRMPKQVYTVGDVMRLEVSFVSEANIVEVRAVFQREDTYASDEQGPVRDVSRSTISFEGSVEETAIAEQRPYRLPLKHHTAVLLYSVDNDHAVGSYNLTHLVLRTAGGVPLHWEPDPGDAIDSFRVAEETDTVQSVEVAFTEEPE